MSEINIVKGETNVFIGDANESDNKIEIKLESLSVKSKVTVNVSFSRGNKEEDLLGGLEDSIKANWKSEGKVVQELFALETEEPNLKKFKTRRPVLFPGTIYLEDFVVNGQPGEAKLTVEVKVTGSPDQTITKTISVKKELKNTVEEKIHHFRVEPSYILHAGQKEITVSFATTGYSTLKLYRNNEFVDAWTADKDKLICDYFPRNAEGEKFEKSEMPSITSVYRLVGLVENEGPGIAVSTVQDIAERTVQVIANGWNQIALPQGSPTRLFVGADFAGKGEERMYGIFKDAKRPYTLYSSATGVDKWQNLGELSDAQHMAQSPGVFYKKKLWLIGGSSVDSDNLSKEVWCLAADPNDQSHRVWSNNKGLNDFPEGMNSRMGHACVVFEDAIWVIGGYNNGLIYNDVWQAKEIEGKLTWTLLNDNCLWKGRLNPAAAVRRGKGGKPEVWLYGGSANPQDANPMIDFWTSKDGIHWEGGSKVEGTNGYAIEIMPSPGKPLGTAFVVAGKTESSAPHSAERLFLIGSFVGLPENQGGTISGNRILSHLFEWHSGTGYWEERPVFNGWQQFRGENFYLQSVYFNRFLFCWSLKNEQFSGKLNILVSN